MITNYQPAIFSNSATHDVGRRKETAEESRQTAAVVLRRLHLGFVSPAIDVNPPSTPSP